MNGIFNVNKPPGKSSHAIVAAIRKYSGIKRVGHGGTLDPMATGVLLVGIGQGVRISEYLLGHDKKYRARVRLGIETDTYDATGAVTLQAPVAVTPEEIQAALVGFLGKISQRPPAYSAIKRDGISLYKLARQGVVVETDAREVEIFSIDVNEVGLPEVEFTVHCSKGTYIRSLAHDLGQKLGCGAHLCGLTRVASGNFKLEDAVTLEELGEAFSNHTAEKFLIPLDRALAQFDSLSVDAVTAKAIKNGIAFTATDTIATSLARVYADGQILALVERGEAANVWRPKKVFIGL
jgi:tRNA pseudouridine55 synthase